MVEPVLLQEVQFVLPI